MPHTCCCPLRAPHLLLPAARPQRRSRTMFGTRCSDKQGIATDMLQLMERFFEEHMLITIDALQLTTTQLPQSFEEAIQRTINVQQVRDRRPLPPPCRSHAASRVARVPFGDLGVACADCRTCHKCKSGNRPSRSSCRRTSS